MRMRLRAQLGSGDYIITNAKKSHRKPQRLQAFHSAFVPGFQNNSLTTSIFKLDETQKCQHDLDANIPLSCRPLD